MLDEEGVVSCHWKGTVALERPATGEKDLDLLVDRGSAAELSHILARCGFKEARLPAGRQTPGILDYYGYDAESDRLVHVHVHYQLVVGHDATHNYHLCIEKPFLASSAQTDLFRIPAPEFEFVVFVIRKALRDATWGAMLAQKSGLSAEEQQELAYLHSRVNDAQVYKTLAEHLPFLSPAVFEGCSQSLQPGCSRWTRLKAGRRLQKDLAGCARRPPLANEGLILWRYLVWGVQRRVFKQVPRRRLANGGAMVAVVGGDGAGKSTAVDGVYAWLSRSFEVRKVHIGKPPWSFTTIVVRGLLKIGTMVGLYPFSTRDDIDPDPAVLAGYPALIRAVCTARDRWLTYIRARRFASNGGLVLCDRFSLPGIMVMDGPQVERMTRNQRTNWFVKALLRLEEKYYRQILPPELLAVLRVDPEVAVLRKTDESEVSVRARTAQVWVLDWEKTPAHVIDAGQSQAQVLSDLKTLIWSRL